jgi:Uma2 family endonuclease
MPIFKRDTRQHTYADYLTWSRDYGDELINGIAYIREPPSPSRRHQEFVGELHRQAANALEGKSCRAYIAPFDVRLPKDGEADDHIDTVVQPDVFIVCDRHKVDERGVRGAPDWLAEVLSPTTASYDQNLKLAAYERAGVTEVWLVQPNEQTLTMYRLQEGHYGRASILELKGQTRLSAVSGVSIDWDRLLANIAAW